MNVELMLQAGGQECSCEAAGQFPPVYKQYRNTGIDYGLPVLNGFQRLA